MSKEQKCKSEELKQEQLRKVSEETMRFMRGKYVLDEIAAKYYDIPCLKFRQGKRTILSVNILADRFDFQIIYGKAEREKFEARRKEFPTEILKIYDESKTHYDGKWMMFPVADLEMLEAIKPLIIIKKKPNRKPLSKEKAVYSACGHRCDLCVHYINISDELRSELKKRVIRVYAEGEGDGGCNDDMQLCDGCDKGGLNKDFSCKPLKCAAEKNHKNCLDCGDFNRSCSPFVGYRGIIEAKNTMADDITYAIFPYMAEEYWD